MARGRGGRAPDSTQASGVGLGQLGLASQPDSHLPHRIRITRSWITLQLQHTPVAHRGPPASSPTVASGPRPHAYSHIHRVTYPDIIGNNGPENLAPFWAQAYSPADADGFTTATAPWTPERKAGARRYPQEPPPSATRSTSAPRSPRSFTTARRPVRSAEHRTRQRPAVRHCSAAHCLPGDPDRSTRRSPIPSRPVASSMPGRDQIIRADRPDRQACDDTVPADGKQLGGRTGPRYRRRITDQGGMVVPVKRLHRLPCDAAGKQNPGGGTGVRRPLRPS